MDTKKEQITIAIGGALLGMIAVALSYFGNPANMGFCIACFIRDSAGALGLHRAAAVEYLRPEIIGVVLGAFLISIGRKEFSAKGGSSPFTRFIMGFFVMIGCLMFLGCPFQCTLRTGRLRLRNRLRCIFPDTRLQLKENLSSEFFRRYYLPSAPGCIPDSSGWFSGASALYGSRRRTGCFACPDHLIPCIRNCCRNHRSGNKTLHGRRNP